VTRPTKLVLVRHGESAWIAEGRFQGHGDPPLSDVGLRQAAAVGARLAAPSETPSLPVPDHPPLAIWHSPLLRAIQTARAVHQAREADAPLRPLDTLIELGQGEWEGLTHDEVRSRWPQELAAWRDDPLHNHAPGGESLSEALVRARAARRTILGGHDASTVDGLSLIHI
jgi:probable phosphoglycerate mutase